MYLFLEMECLKRYDIYFNLIETKMVNIKKKKATNCENVHVADLKKEKKKPNATKKTCEFFHIPCF